MAGLASGRHREFEPALSAAVILASHPPLPLQTYYEVPDQVLVNNHALLAFSGREGNTALFFADIDEFFVPQVTILRTGGRIERGNPCHGIVNAGYP